MAIYSGGRRPTLSFVYMDHLGSILKTTDAAGTILVNQSFDAWGNYRDPSTWKLLRSDQIFTGGLRGFTSHVHLPEFGLINMNGRMYDPLVGRMLSPDNDLQMPEYMKHCLRKKIPGLSCWKEF